MKKLTMFLAVMIWFMTGILADAAEKTKAASAYTGQNGVRLHESRVFEPHDGMLYDSIEDAAASLRNLLKKHENAYVYFEVTKEEYDSRETQFAEVLFRHTGVFNEGDYLENSFVFVGFTNSAVRDEGRYYLGYKIAQSVRGTTAEQDQALYARIEEIIEENGWTDLSGYEQIRAVYDWVCENVSYDHEHFEVCDAFYHTQDLTVPIQESYIPHCAYGAVYRGKSVCSGYAQLLYAFYNKLGVDCRIVSGTGYDQAHDWNIVKLDGVYYFIDATWDSELLQAGKEYAYFLKSKANMADHIADEEDLAGYDIAVHDYDYVPGDASEIVESGTMSGIDWKLMGDGTLAFSGTGEILENPVSDKRRIERIVIGDGISAIGSINYGSWSSGLSNDVFVSCTNLRSVEFGAGLRIIGDQVFDLCESLTEIVIPEGVTDIGYAAFRYCRNLRSIFLPETVRVLRNSLFSGCSQLTDVRIPDSVMDIENYVFDHCRSLVSVNLPSQLQNLGARVFYECSSLERISIPGNVKELKMELFFNCTNLSKVTLNEGLERLGKNVFYNCSRLAKIDLPGTVVALESGCFTMTAIRTIDLPDSMTEIPEALFSDCKYLQSVALPRGIKSIGPYAFAACESLQEIVLHDEIAEVGQYAFMNCSALRTIHIPASLERISYGCFYGCNGLRSVVIPNHIAYIGQQAFAQCRNLVCILFSGNAPEFDYDPDNWNSGAFWNVNARAYYPGENAAWTDDVMRNYDGNITWTRVPVEGDHDYRVSVIEPTCAESGSIAYTCVDCGYQYAMGWNDEIDHTEVSVPGIPATHVTTGLTEGSCCSVCGEITEAQQEIPIVQVQTVRLPAMLKAVDEQAFMNDTFQCVVVPDGCERLETECFANIAELLFAEIPQSVVYIDDTAFSGTGVLIVTTEGSYAQAYAQRLLHPCVIVEPEMLTGN